jgi:hypothetical protein
MARSSCDCAIFFVAAGFAGSLAATAIVPGRGGASFARMLEMRPNCECCDRDLDPSGDEARICSFECTFCASCADGALKGKCPNCGGSLVARPARAADKLARFPASSKRVVKQGGCAG